MILNPLDGDPDSIATHAAAYKLTASRLKNAADDLRDLTDDSTFVSLAVDEVRLKALDARTAAESVSVRYDGAADAMSQYAIDLRAAQDRAKNAIATYVGADGEQSAAQTLANDLKDSVTADNGQTPNLVDDFLAASHALQNFAASTAAAIAEYNAAVDDKITAVNRALTGLKDAADTSNLNDGFFDAIGGAFQQAYEWAQENLAPFLEVLHDALAKISEILDVLAFALAIGAIFFPALAPLAAAVKTVALAVSITVLACSIALVLLGKGSLGDVAAEGIGMAAGKLVGAASNGVKGAMAVAGSPAASVALTQATRQAIELPKGEELLVTVVEEAVGKQVSSGVDSATSGIGNPFTIDLAPSAAGPTWNAPPTISVPPVNTNHEYSMAKSIEGPFTQSVMASATAPSAKSVSAVGA
ncbi:MAG: hypothetical protein JWM51_297 [Microbacteriaceae bacterium]|jgi:hypothetical protein|nr:hypothetical protein [Microbacteriaceae bacterium]